jgi:hypothetical protein
MAERTDPGSAAARLEVALERIAQAATRPPSVEYVTSSPDPEAAGREQELVDLVVERERQLAELTAEHERLRERIATRLDTIINEVREALDR